MASLGDDERTVNEQLDPFGGSPENWSPAEADEYAEWLDAHYGDDDYDGREQWEEECEASLLREMEECERIGNWFGFDTGGEG